MPELAPFDIELLGEHAAFVPNVASWHWDEWGGGYPDSSLEEWTRQLAIKTRTDGLPCSWIALVDGTPAGSVTLELDGVEPRPELTPDLAGLFVLPVYRNRGIGSALVRTCEDGARTFGVRHLYLYTEEAEALYQRLGWETIDRAQFQGEDAAIMRKTL